MISGFPIAGDVAGGQPLQTTQTLTAIDPRKIGRIVHVKAAAGRTTRLQPARITAVGASNLVTCKVLHPSGTVYANIPKWLRSAPTTTGWVR